VGTERGGDDVAAGGRLETPWRARERAAKRETGPGLGRGDAWKKGKQEVERRRRQSGDQGESSAPAAEEEQSSARARGRRREGRGSGGLVWNSQGFQGPLGKERFSTDLGV
jgi:hypothetical protein